MHNRTTLRPALAVWICLQMKAAGFAPHEVPPGMLCLGPRKGLRSLSKPSRAEAIRRRVEQVLALDRAEGRLVARISVIGS